ncbi:transcriptional regulator SPT3 [Sporobolomyces koalae]|uniref:transcriptional regulator SPT3 n=1 Tax=Sporobolomyces koalae TaxID=500713 RepID=UPI00317076A6
MSSGVTAPLLAPVASSGGKSGSTTLAAATVSNSTSYHAEISQMLYVFTMIDNPASAVVQFIQDVVRHELVHLVMQARLQSSRVRPVAQGIQVEDMLFLVRNDVAKLQRLESYLGWKDVRKRTKPESTCSSAGITIAAGCGAAAAGTADEDDMVEGIAQQDEPLASSSSSSSSNTVLPKQNLPWHLDHPWNEFVSTYNLATSGRSSASATPKPSDDAATPVPETPSTYSTTQERRAFHLNREILREANDLTETMSREEYEQYSNARQASFVYRKSKKLRDFLMIDHSIVLSDEVLDILGFLAYEIVRVIARAGTERNSTRTRSKVLELQQRQREEQQADQEASRLDPRAKDFPSVLRPAPSPSVLESGSIEASNRGKRSMSGNKRKRKLEPIVSLFSAPPPQLLPVELGSPSPSTNPETTVVEDPTLPLLSSSVTNPPKPKLRKLMIDYEDVVQGYWDRTSRTETVMEEGEGRGNRVKMGMGKGLRLSRGGIGSARGLIGSESLL